jgi:tyrosyl-tRNA synthetase
MFNHMKTITDIEKINEVLDRGIVTDIIPSKKDLLEFLSSGERLKIYFGADPTSTSLHLGHAGNYMFLEDLRRLGHEVIVLIGDFTALIGDPSGRDTARPALSEAQIADNMRDWISQIRPLLGFDDKKNPVGIVYNSKWLAGLTLRDVISLASHFTVQQMIERDMFEKRWEKNVPIHLHEFLYPLMQGYDSVAMDVNAELCGTDQLFNALAGRMLLKKIKNKEKFVITLKLLQNPKTGEMMSKSKGTGVFLASTADNMYGAIMAQPDEMTEALFVHCTRIPLSRKAEILKTGPKEAKMRVAFEITKIIHGEKAADAAQENFEKIFSKKDLSNADLPTVNVPDAINLVDLVILCFKSIGIEKSRGEARRLIVEGALKIDGQSKGIWDDPKEIFKPQTEVIVIGIGKFHHFRLTPDWSR